MAEKLYPPTISNQLPAFYSEENGTATIAVPFIMNRAVKSSEISGLRLQIKTVYSNSYLASLDASEIDWDKNIAYFTFMTKKPDPDPDQETETETETGLVSITTIKPGQFLKIQMAYLDSSNEHQSGYFSTVGIIKYTAKPTIELMTENQNTENVFLAQQTYYGVYSPNALDVSEKEYSYCFKLYDINNTVIEDSGWLLHNSENDNDSYSFKVLPVNNQYYEVSYGARTINGLEVWAEKIAYTCALTEDILNYFELKADNDFEEGLMRLRLKLKLDSNLQSQYTFATSVEEFLEEYPRYNDGDYTVSLEDKQFKVYDSPIPDEGTVIFSVYQVDIHKGEKRILELYRAEKTDNYQSWQLLTKIISYNYQTLIENWRYEDFSCEQGIYYKYVLQEANGQDIINSSKIESNIEFSDFEDMFLRDASGRQLKVKFNPKISSFKTTRMEQKIDTIGSRYPFIFRNGNVSYKEFPISGLISYKVDEHEMFIDHEKDLNIILAANSGKRTYQASYEEEYIEANPQPETQQEFVNGEYYIQDKVTGKYKLVSKGDDIDILQIKDDYRLFIRKRTDLEPDDDYVKVETLNSLGYNLQAERRFKLEVMDWLGNGEIKMFKSPTEGNYLVRLLNISLAPEDRLGRMLHTFSCTAYEMAEFNYDSLVSLGFINLEKVYHNNIEETFNLNKYLSNYLNENSDNLGDSVCLHKNRVINYFAIQNINKNTPPINIWIGNSEKCIRIANDFILYDDGKPLPNIYYPWDNATSDLPGKDVMITYRYYDEEKTSVNEITIENRVLIEKVEEEKTYNFKTDNEEPIRFFVINFNQKDKNNTSNIDNYVEVEYMDGIIKSYKTPISLHTTSPIKSITIRKNVILECAYQVRVKQVSNND